MPDGYSLRGKRVWVAGHTGMVGSALVRRLAREPCEVIVTDHGRVDLRRQDETASWLSRTRPDLIFLAAAKVGGILANARSPADFLYDNLMIEANVISGAHAVGVKKLVFLGSSCIYPKLAPQPITEAALLSGPLEPTNEAYAIAKIAGIKLCQAFRAQHGADFVAAMPCNLYGPGDNFDPLSSHVLPGLIRKAHEAKVSGARDLVVWGSGAPRREFLHVDDCADALVHIARTYSDSEPINVGFGEDISIADAARLVAQAVGFAGDLVFDRSKPDGTPRKLMNVHKLHSRGWRPAIDLEQGLAAVYQWYLSLHSEPTLALG